jgi:hypothetical protein
VTPPRARPDSAARAAVLAGTLAGFVALVDLVRLVRFALLTDRDASWAAARLLLGLGVAAAAAGAAILAAAAVCFLALDRRFEREAVPLPFQPRSLALFSAGAVVLGTAVRFAALGRIPDSLFLDDVSLIDPTLALAGSWGDFADAIRPVPFGVPKLFGTVGVVYLEAFRQALRAFGTTVFGLRFLSAFAGAASIVTAGLLARSLLPRGGGTLAAVALAGLRWHLILSRWGWNMIVLAPVVDLATLLLIRARRRSGPGAAAGAAAAGVLTGLGAHIYLAGWIAGAALGGFSLCPGAKDDGVRARVRRALFFGAGFLVAVAPLFLLREGRAVAYFARTRDHNIFREVRYQRSLAPLFSTAAEALVAPWITADPTSRQDLPGRSRLGWILGIPLLAVFTRSIVRPREELSGLLLVHAGAALAATLAGGESGNPNGARFAYLTTVTAVAVAAGIQLLLADVLPASRRAAALAALGLLAVAGTLGTRDALLRWPDHRETFDGFHGSDTLIGRAAARWEQFGRVDVSGGLGHSPVTIGGVRRYRLDPNPPVNPRGERARDFHIWAPGSAPSQDERVVERVRDAWGREWAVVLGRTSGS